MATEAFLPSKTAAEVEEHEPLLDQTTNNSSIRTATSSPEFIFHESLGSITPLAPPLEVIKKFKRSRTAPAMAFLKALNSTSNDEKSKPTRESELSDSVESIRLAGLLLLVYLTIGVVIYSFNRDQFSGTDTHTVIDAFYFCIVTMCTIGYGDITPLTPFAKVFACFFVLIGFGFIDILLSGLVNYVLDLQENMILAGMAKEGKGKHHHRHDKKSHSPCRFSAMDFVVDVAKGRMRIRLKVGLALGVVLLSIGIGSLVLHLVEGLDWVDSVYLAVMSVTTVGYGDKAFKTTGGRWFAAVWLLLSTLAVARAFLYLAEARIAKRHRRIADKILQRDITIDDLLSADMNNTNFISKSEYVVYKLKQMGKIGENDIAQICVQFNRLEHNQSGKITLPDLFANL
ncbi:hypothetical protein Leryth_017125 [Lithospermum erythrorhizon]|nr:hypothetical protein Leryth_017125 [Lithospermum erythrorhizon]